VPSTISQFILDEREIAENVETESRAMISKHDHDKDDGRSENVAIRKTDCRRISPVDAIV